MKRILPLLWLLASVTMAQAQAPEQFNYQAVLRDASGNALINTLVNLRLSIHAGSPSGTIGYQEEHLLTTSDFGLINLQIGNGTIQLGTMASIEWGADFHYLQIEQDITGGTTFSDMGTVQLVSVPYSLHANSVDLHLDNTLEGSNTSIDPLRIAQQGALVGEVLLWNGSTWIPGTVDSQGECSTLDQAYDCGGSGSGRIVSVDAGPVELTPIGYDAMHIPSVDNGEKGIKIDITGQNSTALWVNVNGDNSDGLYIGQSNVGGRGIYVEQNADGLAEYIHSSSSGSSIYVNKDLPATGYGIEVVSRNPADITSSIHAKNLGNGYGISGKLGIENPLLPLAPESGLQGFSYEDLDGHNGVSGISKGYRGVFGLTYRANVLCTNPITPALSLKAGVYGLAHADPNISGQSGFVGVVGHSDDTGHGVWGIGTNHGFGVMGISGAGENEDANSTIAGVWGVTQDAGGFAGTYATFPLCDDQCNKKMVGVLGQSKDHIALWGESLNSIGLVTSQGKLKYDDLPGGLKAGLYSSTNNALGTAAYFRQDIISGKPAVDVFSKSGDAGIRVTHIGSGDAVASVIVDPTSGGKAISGNTVGTGNAGSFQVLNPLNASAALQSLHLGTGSAFTATQTNIVATSPAAIVETFGEVTTLLCHSHHAMSMAPVLLLINDSKGSAATIVSGNMTNISPAVNIDQTGLGIGLNVSTANPLTTEPTIFAHQSGTGHIAYLENLSTSTSEGIKLMNLGSGSALSIEGGHPSADAQLLVEYFAAPTAGSGRVAHFGQTLIAPSPGAMNDNCVLISTNVLNPTIPALKVTTPIPAGGGSTYAAEFNGRVDITGSLDVGGSLDAGSVTASVKMFRIDHPLDPQNKYLQHACIESNEMLNVYSGNILLSESGIAEIQLPDWFDALNEDYRYQLTCVGGYSNIYILKKIEDGRFIIGGGSPGLEVSWQVTGVRHDAFAKSNPLQVELTKTVRKAD